MLQLLSDRIAAFAATRWQEWMTYLKGMSLDDIQALLDRYSALGPLPGILLPLAESLLPFLPLIVIVVGNALSYGLWLGFLYSWIGACCGAILVFMLARHFGSRYGERIRKRMPRMERFFSWVERKGFTPIFILSCLPFSPSVVVNVASGISKIQMHTFVIAIILGKAVMIFTLCFLGHDLNALVHQPWRLLIAAAILAALWFVGKRLEGRYVG